MSEIHEDLRIEIDQNLAGRNLWKAFVELSTSNSIVKLERDVHAHDCNLHVVGVRINKAFQAGVDDRHRDVENPLVIHGFIDETQNVVVHQPSDRLSSVVG